MVMIDKKGNVDYRFIILLSVIMAFIAQLRGNGIYVIAVTLVIYSVYLLWKRNAKMAGLLLVLTVTFILLISALDVAYDVDDNAKDAMMTKIAHMLADYDLNLEIEDADRKEIHKLLAEDRINSSFKMTVTDPILHITNAQQYESNKGTYIGLALKYSLKYPQHCLEYLFDSSPMVWNIVRDHWAGRPYYLSGEQDRLQADFNTYYGNHHYTPTTPYENLSYVNWGTPAFDTLNLMALGIEGCLLDTVFNNPALYMYISFILLIIMQIMVKSKEIWLMYVPNLLNIIIVFFSTPIQDYRYLYANLLVCYLLVIIYIRTHQRFREKIQD